jgi:hypothetical protein
MRLDACMRPMLLNVANRYRRRLFVLIYVNFCIEKVSKLISFLGGQGPRGIVASDRQLTATDQEVLATKSGIFRGCLDEESRILHVGRVKFV